VATRSPLFTGATVSGRDVRNPTLSDDDVHINTDDHHANSDPVAEIYELALPQVYGYLLSRCGSVAVAEDLTAETFMAAVAATRARSVSELTVAWLVAVARHKLVDHWRRLGRERRAMAAAENEAALNANDDPWDGVLDTDAALAALSRLSLPQRAALTLRYLDALPVPAVAEHLGRSVHATETLLVRARAALRRIYGEEGGDDG
jgi:RNA polymerase sigma-70 factor (ECF subfamily)